MSYFDSVIRESWEEHDFIAGMGAEIADEDTLSRAPIIGGSRPSAVESEQGSVPEGISAEGPREFPNDSTKP